MLDWNKFTAIAERFQYKAKLMDREDLRQDIIVRLADVARHNGDKPLTEGTMIRIASHTVADYWRTQYKFNNGLDCGSCSPTQRLKCRSEDSYYRCQRAIKVESLSKPIVDGEGNITELGELIADDKALDLPEWADATAFLLSCPQRLIAIAEKVHEGDALSNTERQYLWYWRKREQKSLALT